MAQGPRQTPAKIPAKNRTGRRMVSGRETMLAPTLKISSSTPFSGKQSTKFTRWIEAKRS